MPHRYLKAGAKRKKIEIDMKRFENRWSTHRKHAESRADWMRRGSRNQSKNALRNTDNIMVV